MRNGARVDTGIAVMVLMLRFVYAYSICYKNLCTGWSSRKPSLRCPQNTLILITNVICRGRNECPAGIHANALNVCSGRRTCTLNNQLYTSMCGERNERRVEITYTCAINTSKNIERSCGQKRLTNDNGFIQSPGYPSAFKDATTCWWTLAIPYNQQAYIRVYEMQSLQNTGRTNTTLDQLRVTPRSILPQCESGEERVAYFGTTSRVRSMIVRCHSNVEIMFQHNSGKGVRMWLFYQVLPKGENPSSAMPSSLTSRCIDDRGIPELTGPRARIAVVTRHDSMKYPVTDSGISLTTTMPVDGVTVYMEKVHVDTVLLVSISVGAVLVIAIVTSVAIICVKRKKKMLEAAYKESSLPEDRAGRSRTPVTTRYQGMDELDSIGTPTYETIDSIMTPQVSDTYYRVVDEMPFPPPRPRLSNESEDFDNASDAYAEVHSLHYGSPSQYMDYREQMKERIRNKQLSECDRIEESELNLYSDPCTTIVNIEDKKQNLHQPYSLSDIVNSDTPSYCVIGKRFNPPRMESIDNQIYEPFSPS